MPEGEDMTRSQAGEPLYSDNARRPNILLIVADQMAAPALPMYGNTVVRAPNMERLAAAGSTFDSAYCVSPLCAPSRFSLLTGKLCSHIGAYDNASELPATVPTIAHYLRFLGYRTCLSGKMHFIGPDQLHGYETRLTTEIYSAGLELALAIWPENAQLATQLGFPPDWGGAVGAVVNAGPCERSLQIDYDDEVQFHAVRQIYDFARDDDQRPFFLTVSFTQPHDPFTCAQAYWDLYSDEEVGLPKIPRPDDEAMHPVEKSLLEFTGFWKRETVTEAEIVAARRAYYGMISDVDARIGELLEALRRTGQLNDTLVILTADHGEMLGERGQWYKRNFFEPSVRVPLVFCGPLGEAAPSRIGLHVSQLDLLPTLFSVAGGRADNFVGSPDGRDLSPLLAGNPLEAENRVVSELLCDGVTGPNMMIREDRWKYWYSHGNPPMLFDLDADPDEQLNLAGESDHHDTLASFEAQLEERWNVESLKSAVLESQRARMLVCHAHKIGQPPIWDYAVPGDPLARYMRPETEFWQSIEDRARLPKVKTVSKALRETEE